MNQINFNREKFDELKQLYKIACDTGREIFMFEGNELLTSYAKYLIEYLAQIFERDKKT
jgi:phage anti-repressor protein